MTREVVGVEELASLGEITDLMETRRIKQVPIVHDGKIVGIVSRGDLLQVLASGGATTSDEAGRLIRERLLAELRRQEWAKSAESNVVVWTVSCILGGASDRRRRKVLLVVAENIAGVRSTEDHTVSRRAICRRSSRRFEAARHNLFLPGQWTTTSAMSSIS